MNLISFPTKLRIVADENTETEVFSSLEEFMNRNKPKIDLEEKVKEIKDMQDRIKYYIDEIDMFTPRRR